jgi:hypothetical protein
MHAPYSRDSERTPLFEASVISMKGCRKLGRTIQRRVAAQASEAWRRVVASEPVLFTSTDRYSLLHRVSPVEGDKGECIRLNELTRRFARVGVARALLDDWNQPRHHRGRGAEAAASHRASFGHRVESFSSPSFMLWQTKTLVRRC